MKCLHDINNLAACGTISGAYCHISSAALSTHHHGAVLFFFSFSRANINSQHIFNKSNFAPARMLFSFSTPPPFARSEKQFYYFLSYTFDVFIANCEAVVGWEINLRVLFIENHRLWSEDDRFDIECSHIWFPRAICRNVVCTHRLKCETKRIGFSNKSFNERRRPESTNNLKR